MAVDVAILGSGAVGALVGAALVRSGASALLVTREATADRLAAEGLRVTSPRFGELHVDVPAAPRLAEPAGALLVAVKAPDLRAALERVEAEPDVVVPLLNGVDHVAVLHERFGDRVVAGVIRVQAHREGPTHVVHRAPFVTVALADPPAVVAGATDRLAAALTAAEVDVSRGGSEATVLWGKLARLAGLALATTAADAPLGEVRADAEAVAREVVPVAAAEGAGLDADRLVGELRALPDAASSSLRADVTAGVADHELDAIAGAVLRGAARHGLRAPRTAELAERIAARARGTL
ncbi:MAG TPA: 2-dehydropantoate 2-reductase [Baekduia sp.]|nr:2-dehydropantoate 2-reductase [Baekduia sp.]